MRTPCHAASGAEMPPTNPFYLTQPTPNRLWVPFLWAFCLEWGASRGEHVLKQPREGVPTPPLRLNF